MIFFDVTAMDDGLAQQQVAIAAQRSAICNHIILYFLSLMMLMKVEGRRSDIYTTGLTES